MTLETGAESEKVRLADWIAAHPELSALCQRAHQLAEEAKTA